MPAQSNPNINLKTHPQCVHPNHRFRQDCMACSDGHNEAIIETSKEVTSKRRKHSAAHGNFPAYYQVRGGNTQSAASAPGHGHLDPRVDVLLHTLRWHDIASTPARILDIGCNQGRVGIELGECVARE